MELRIGLGTSLGLLNGAMEGMPLGVDLGLRLGMSFGPMEGAREGISLGMELGLAVGTPLVPWEGRDLAGSGSGAWTKTGHITRTTGGIQGRTADGGGSWDQIGHITGTAVGRHGHGEDVTYGSALTDGEVEGSIEG
jgi:hypothetical protein